MIVFDKGTLAGLGKIIHKSAFSKERSVFCYYTLDKEACCVEVSTLFDKDRMRHSPYYTIIIFLHSFILTQLY